MSGLGIFHICLLVLYLRFSLYLMAALTAVSVLLYVFCYVRSRQNKNLLLVFNLSYAEIMLHAVVSVFLLGADSGFSLYIIAMLPLGYYAAYNFNSKKKPVNPMFYVIFSIVAFCFVQAASNYVEPIYTYGNERIDRFIYLINFFVAVFTIVIFFSTLVNQIKHLEYLRIHQNKELEKLSKTDALTGLANRRSIEERYMGAELEQAEYAVILGDIDDFKKVNDTYGHNVGDQVLKEVAEVLKKAVRGKDTVCRWGGEEILLFLPGCPLDNAKYRAEDILKNIRELDLKAQDGRIFHITMTLGVAVSGGTERFMEVVKKADDRMYEGKRNGKDQVV